jgi:hypothetical protein
MGLAIVATVTHQLQGFPSWWCGGVVVAMAVILVVSRVLRAVVVI